MSWSGDTTKTVVELDLVSYSDIARVLEENLDVYAVKAFQDQIQSFVDEGLRQLGLRRDEVVFGTAGDNALLFFDDAVTAHWFSEAVQKASTDHNHRKGVESAKRWFRIGAATGMVLVLESERRIVGTTVTRAVRLEAAARRGQLVVDAQTFNSLPDELKLLYGSEEIVCGKRDERYAARRCTFIEEVSDPDDLSNPDDEYRLRKADRGFRSANPAMLPPINTEARGPGGPARSQTVGKYELVQLIGQTGCGMTWQARDTALAHDVILKRYSFRWIIADKLAHVATRVRQRARLRHPALVTPVDVFPVDEDLFVVTPFHRDVQSLREYIGSLGWQAVPPETACQLISQVAFGLSHAHAMGVSHQSLDPWDILVDPDARVWVAGFEKAVVYESYQACDDGFIHGTLTYASPELFHGMPLDAGTDVFHVGIILFELVTGRLPLHSSDLMGSMDDESSLRVSADWIADRKLRAICLKCLRQRKKDRFADAGELYWALRSITEKKHWWQVWK